MMSPGQKLFIDQKFQSKRGVSLQLKSLENMNLRLMRCLNLRLNPKKKNLLYDDCAILK